VIIGSWNYSQSGSTAEWNIALEEHNDQLYAAYSNEVSQLIAGYFHYNPAKSHADDHSSFFLTGAWTNGWVRFSPYTNSNIGADNALTDITNRIAQTQQEIVFALNDCTQLPVATQLVNACNRGVTVNGVMPDSDTTNPSGSLYFYNYLTNSANYATTNRVVFWTAFAKADYSATDTNTLLDLVHCKWMAIDPFGSRPWLIHGSANWSAAATLDDYSAGNDENIVFIPHRDIARIFYSHFKRITGAFQTRSDFWLDSSANNFGAWFTDTNSYAIEHTFTAAGGWNVATTTANFIGLVALTNAGASVEFLRVRRN
jgi:phosphatidylserine/phosphatidylglycerophosphate/cardiolipin synthase-like enzyme